MLPLSLLKTAKDNPILIELCPPSRHDCFYNNAKCLGFLPFFIITECNEKEEILLNDKQIDNLYKLLNILIK